MVVRRDHAGDEPRPDATLLDVHPEVPGVRSWKRPPGEPARRRSVPAPGTGGVMIGVGPTGLRRGVSLSHPARTATAKQKTRVEKILLAMCTFR